MRLNDPLLVEYEHNGVIYRPSLAYDVVVDVLELLQDNTFTKPQKVTTALYLLLGKDLEMSLSDQAELFMALSSQFFGSGQEEGVLLDITGNPMPRAQEAQSYDLIVDGSLIYASFYQAYGIDLIEEQGKLRWEKFLALLQGLPSNTSLMQVIDIRTRELPSGKGSEKERAKLQELKRRYALPERS